MVILGTGFYTGFYTGRVSGRVWIFLIKPGPDPDPFRVFFLNPYPTLFLIGPGKIRPIRVGPDRVPADRVKIAIPNLAPHIPFYGVRVNTYVAIQVAKCLAW